MLLVYKFIRIDADYFPLRGHKRTECGVLTLEHKCIFTVRLYLCVHFSLLLLMAFSSVPHSLESMIEVFVTAVGTMSVSRCCGVSFVVKAVILWSFSNEGCVSALSMWGARRSLYSQIRVMRTIINISSGHNLQNKTLIEFFK